jgi:hypothetical protein
MNYTECDRTNGDASQLVAKVSPPAPNCNSRLAGAAPVLLHELRGVSENSG